jgi:hypothetical protein
LVLAVSMINVKQSITITLKFNDPFTITYVNTNNKRTIVHS